MMVCPTATKLIFSSLQVGEVVIDRTSKVQAFVIHPQSLLRLFWGLLGCIFVLYDAVMIPLDAFDIIGDAEGVRFVPYITFSYWILDLVFQFLVGFEDGNIVEMRPQRIFRHYLTGWFLVDLSIVVTDIVVVVLELAFEAHILTTGSRSLRAARFLRICRLIRLARMHRLGQVQDMVLCRIRTETTALLAKLFHLLVLIVLINHYIACVWYGIAAESMDEFTWVGPFVDEHSNVEVYTMALHWSLTQFTPATNNIAPQNSRERAFAICIVLFALVMVSSFISGVTNAATRIQALNLQQLREEASIRQYMRRHGISADLASRIQRFVKRNYKARMQQFQEQDIPFFREVPESLRRRLHEEVYMPHLKSNRILCDSSHLDKTFLGKVCHHAMSEVSHLPLQDVFVDGMDAEQVYLPTMGSLVYTSTYLKGGRVRINSGSEPEGLEERSILGWLSELSLFIHFAHCGQLAAETSCQVMELNVKWFHLLIPSAETALFESMRLFAIYFVGYAESQVEEGLPVTDLPFDQDALDQIAERHSKTWHFSRYNRAGTRNWNELLQATQLYVEHRTSGDRLGGRTSGRSNGSSGNRS